MGRFSSPELYEDASDATRARASYDDAFDDSARTRSARESHHALADSDDVATRYGREAAHVDADEAVTHHGEPLGSHVDSDEVATRYGKPTPAAGRPASHHDSDDIATRFGKPTPAAGRPASRHDSDDVATRFARPAAYAIADSDEVATSDGRDVDGAATRFAASRPAATHDADDADDAATRFAATRPAATHAFVAPAEIEGDRSPAMRARRSSHAPAPERASRPSYVAPSEQPLPPPPRPSQAEIERRARASYVASSERADFASSAPDLSLSIDGHYSSSEIEELVAPKSVDYDALKSYLFDDISTSLQQPALPAAPLRTTNPNFPAPPHASSVAPPARRPSEHPASSAPPARRPSQHPAGRPSQHPASSAPPARKSAHPSFAPPNEVASRERQPSQYPGSRERQPSQYPGSRERQPSQYPGSRERQPSQYPANPSFAPSNSRERRSSQHPANPASAPPQATQESYASPMGLSLSSATPVAPIQPRPHLRSAYPMQMQMPVAQESYVDASWAAGTPPPFSQPQLPPAPDGFKLSLSAVAAGLAAAAALVVMICAIVFVRADDKAAPTFAMRAPVDAPVTSSAQQPAVAKTAAPAPMVASTAMPASSGASTVSAVKTSAAPAQKKKVVAAIDEDSDDAVGLPSPKATVKAANKPAPPAVATTTKKSTGRVGDQTVEQMLAELGEEQIKR